MKALLLAILIFGVALAVAVQQRDRIKAVLRVQKERLQDRQFLSALDGITRLPEARIAMPDGVELATDLYLPERADTPLPTIMMRLPYGKRRFGEVRQWANLFLPAGYAVVVQDMRGRYNSGGVFAPYPDDAADGAATLDWITGQAWSDGQVGTIGCSALGETQMTLATTQHPALKAMIPLGAGGAIGTLAGSYGFFGMFDGGILNLASAFGWFVEAGGKTGGRMGMPAVDYARGHRVLPLREAVAQFRDDPTDFSTYLDEFDNAEYWAQSGFIAEGDTFATPFLMVDSWFDRAGESLALATHMRATGATGTIVILPGLHCDLSGGFADGAVGDLPLDPANARDFDALFLQFMDARMKGGTPPDLPPVLYYVLNEDRWREADSWPPSDSAPRTIYLSGDGLKTVAPQQSSRLTFVSDPMNPVPSLGGTMCCTGEADLRAGPLYQNPIEGRDDLLVLTSDPLEQAITLAGPVTATLFVQTDVPDTDLVLRLTDVDPEGNSLMIHEGSLRLRYRQGMDQPQLMQPGEVYEVPVILRDIAYRVPEGHRLRLHVTGSSFPRLARNMNGGADNPYAETQAQPATITLHMGAETPSRLRLTTLPPG